MSLLGAIGGALTGLATGGIGGAVIGAATALSGGGGGTALPGTGGYFDKYAGLRFDEQKSPAVLPGVGTGTSIFPAGLPTPDSVRVTVGGTQILGPAGLYASGSGTATGYFSDVRSGSSSTAAACQLGSGTHLNKTGYFLKSGQYVAPRTKCVKNRRRNPLNPRALSRAMGRLASAKRAAKALDRFEVKGRRCR